MLHDYNPKVVTVTETWLPEAITDSEIIPPLYNILRNDREYRGGGVAIILKNRLNFVVLDEVLEIESLWLKLTSILLQSL